MLIALHILLYGCIALLLYAWVAYPVLLLAAHHLTRDTRQPIADSQSLHTNAPLVIVLLSAFNEADVIAARIANLLDMDYPHDRMRVLIGTDGCTDHTAACAKAAAANAAGIEVIAFTHNRGKVAVLRELVERARQLENMTAGTLLAFTDANTHFRRDALRMLVRHFNNPEIGGVCGRLVFTGDRSDSEKSYWSFETMLKTGESAIDSCLGANGAIYALRADCFWPDIPANTIVDDFVIGMKVREAGWRMLYDPDAIAEEDVPDVRNEWNRRVRIGSGDYQAASLCRACLHPRFGRFAWCFWSHKILRWFTPHLALITLGASATLTATSARECIPHTLTTVLTQAICLGAAALLLAALAGRLARPRARNGMVWQLCYGIDHFVTMQAALLVGFIRYCRGNLSGAWSRTPRTAI